jgi:hypothetical protein
MAEPSITGGGSGADPFSSVSGSSTGGVSAKGIKAVVNQVKALNQELRVTERLTQGISRAKGAFSGGGGGIAGSGGIANAGHVTANMGNATTPTRTSYIMDAVRSGGGTGGGGGGLMSGMGGMMGMGKADMFSAVGGAVGGAIGAIDKSLDARIARGYEYSSSADKMAVMYQQIMGVSNKEYREEFRKPLTQKYMLLGMGGANQLLGMQAQYGINAQQQAKSIEAMRVLSGFSITAGQGAQMVTELGSAQTANRMLMTSGMSLYKPGGGQRSSMEVIQQLARSSGLLDRSGKDLEGALVQGSRTRTTLSYMGVGSDIQDQVIQYAMANAQFKDKVGGKDNGNQLYDPANREHRKIMGIQDNFALQQEVTESFKVNREERFYGRQQDNFAALERRTQNLTEAFAALEDKLSGIIGQDIKYQNEKGLARSVGKFAGPALSIAGMAMLATPAAPFAPIVMGAGGLVTGISQQGDPPETPQAPANASAQTTFPSRSGKQVTLDQIKSNSKFSKLHPQMRDRLTRMIVASGGRVGFGGGWRSASEQESLFRSRYTPTDEVTDIQWNGQYYKHTSGDPAAPPGRSMHEIGLAADLMGDMEWVKANAHRFGLKHFGAVNGEDYHVQPAELPNSRREYEENGSPWGTDGNFKPGDKFGERRGRKGAVEESGAHGGGGGLTITAFRGQTQAEMIDSFINANRLSGLSNPGGGPARATAGRKARTPMTQNASPLIGGGQSLDPKSLVSILRANGWGPQLTEAVGVTWRESRWNPRSHNDSYLRGGRDDSYGLFQINMNPNETSAEANRKAWGIPNNEALYDPSTNSRIAREMFNGRGWNPWGPNGTQFRGVDLAAAAATVREADRTGDPMVPSVASSHGGGGGSQMSVVGGTTINIAPTINIQATNNPTADYEKAAKQLTMLIEKEARRYLMRSY